MSEQLFRLTDKALWAGIGALLVIAVASGWLWALTVHFTHLVETKEQQYRAAQEVLVPLAKCDPKNRATVSVLFPDGGNFTCIPKR